MEDHAKKLLDIVSAQMHAEGQKTREPDALLVEEVVQLIRKRLLCPKKITLFCTMPACDQFTETDQDLSGYFCGPPNYICPVHEKAGYQTSAGDGSGTVRVYKGGKQVSTYDYAEYFKKKRTL